MAVPSYLSTDFATTELNGVSDWNTVLPEIGTLLTSTLPVASRWTDLGSGEYRCPAQEPSGANRFFSVVFTRISATRLQVATKNKGGTTIYTGTIDFTGSMTCKLFAGPYHIVVQADDGSLEVAYSFMTDPTPFSLDSATYYVYAWTHRNSAGTAYFNPNQFGVGSLVTNDAGSTTPRFRGLVWRIANGTISGYSAAGSSLVMPYAVSEVDTFKFVGHGYQMLLLPYDLAFGTVVTVPLDDGIFGDFEVIGLVAPSTSFARLGVRVA